MHSVSSGFIAACPWIAHRKHKELLWSKQCETLFLLLLSWIRWILFSSEKSPALFVATAFNNTDLTVSQWYVPSCSRSSWSWWRTIFVTIMDICEDILGSNPFPSARRNDSLFEQWIIGRVAGRVHTIFLLVLRNTNFLNAIGSSFFHAKSFPYTNSPLLRKNWADLQK